MPRCGHMFHDNCIQTQTMTEMFHCKIIVPLDCQWRHTTLVLNWGNTWPRSRRIKRDHEFGILVPDMTFKSSIVCTNVKVLTVSCDSCLLCILCVVLVETVGNSNSSSSAGVTGIICQLNSWSVFGRHFVGASGQDCAAVVDLGWRVSSRRQNITSLLSKLELVDGSSSLYCRPMTWGW